jgi:hypothetical protein
MNKRVVLVTILMLASCVAQARITAAEESSSLLDRANRNAEKITAADDFIFEIDDALDMARDGQYGRLTRGELTRITTARDTIARLLEGHDNAMELPPQERIELYNAQELITATINNDDKSRIVCLREARLGSRLSTTECLTVAEREIRRNAAYDSVDKQQRQICIPSDTQSCER